jgi:hypothetical protein
MTMHKVVLEAPRVVRIVDGPPAAAGAGQALVRLRRAGICGSDLAAYRGISPMVTYPRVLGHELLVDVLECADREYTPRQGGRPLALTSETLLQFYHQYADCGPRGIVLDWTRAEVARELRVRMKTIERREGALIAAGTIRREVSVERQRSFVILSPATWTHMGCPTGFEPATS